MNKVAALQKETVQLQDTLMRLQKETDELLSHAGSLVSNREDAEDGGAESVDIPRDEGEDGGRSAHQDLQHARRGRL